MGPRRRSWIALGAVAAVLLAASLPAAVAHRTRSAGKVTLKDNPRFHGRVTSDSPKCERFRKVKILKVKDGPDDLLTTVGTNRRGRWQALFGLATGNFYARIRPKDVGSAGHSHICKGDRSPSFHALPGPVVGPGGAILADDGANDVTFIASGQCQDLVKPGWELVRCRQVTMPGGQAMWVIEKKTTGSGVAWATRIYVPSAGAGEWATELQVLDETGGVYAKMGAKTTHLTSAANEIVVCVRFDGTGSFLAYDVVTWPQAQVLPDVAAHRGEFRKGKVVFGSSPALIKDYALDGSSFTKSTIQWDPAGDVFRITGTQASASAPASQIC